MVRFLGAAKADMGRIDEYYRIISPPLAKRFRSALRFAVRAIALNPLLKQVRANGVRRWQINGFPHGVFYRVADDEVVVLAILHDKQSPSDWRSPI